jgi:CRISPR/Cas system CSM-associated protein Csm5 (group 7 of RAMP superfamily)
LFDIEGRNGSFLEEVNRKYKVNLMEVNEEFKTKLADFGKESEDVSGDDDCLDLVLNFDERNDLINEIKNIDESENRRERNCETQMVGKNQVSIPVLNLPNKSNSRVTIEEELVEQVKVNINESREELIKDLKNTRIELP